MKAKTKVAIQGKQGSFHHIVAQRYFGAQLDLLPCDTFDDTIQTLVDGESEQAVLAIENSIAGSIIPNYALIDQNDLQIVGEYSLSIHHNLMALPGQTLTDLKEVYSHPMALLQCKDFFKAHPHIRLVEAEDTADEARRIAENAISGIAAIASEQAAALYGLSILAPSIQTIKNNITRFVIVQKNGILVDQKNINKGNMATLNCPEEVFLAKKIKFSGTIALILVSIIDFSFYTRVSFFPMKFSQECEIFCTLLEIWYE